METKSLKIFYNKYGKFAMLAIVSLLLFCAGFWKPMMFVATAIVCAFYLTCNLGEILCFSLYFHLFTTFNEFYMISLSFGFAVVIVRYIFDLYHKKRKFFALPFILTTLIVLVFSLIKYQTNWLGVEQGILFIMLLYVMYLAFVYKDSISVEKCFKYLMLGFVVSALLSVCSLIFKDYLYPISHFDGFYYRVKLFTIHENHLAMYATFAIAYALYEIINKKGKWLINISRIIICLVFGLLTLSKSFIIMCIGFIAYIIIYLLMRYKWKSLKVVIPVAIVLVVLGFACKGLIIKILNRFLIYDAGISLINQITTGRSGIWYVYVNEITSSIPKMLFGSGIFASELIDIGTHNVWFFFAYRIGLVGVIMLGVLCWSYIRTGKSKIKLSYKNILLLLTFIILSLNEMIFSERFFIFLILGIILITTQKDNLNEKIK